MFRRILLGLALLGAFTATAAAESFSHGDITVTDPWARASAGPARNGAAFLTIISGGDADRLVAASAPVAKKTELHTHLMEDGVMKMRPVEAIDVAAEEATVLQPGGLHIMFMGLHEPLTEGESFPLTLTFEKAGEMTVEVPVLGPGAMSATGKAGGMKHQNMRMKHGN